MNNKYNQRNFPTETKNILEFAIMMYSAFKEEEQYKNDPIIRKMTSHDKKCLSLLISLLTIPGTVKETLNNQGITIEKLLPLMHLENLEEMEVDDQIVGKYQAKYFNFVDKLSAVHLVDSVLYPEVICNRLLSCKRIKDFTLRVILSHMESSKAYDHLEKSGKEKVPGLKILSDVRERKNDLETLRKFGEFLTDKDFITNPAVGREKELYKMQKILLSPDKSLLLYGEAGCGKTSLVLGLAYQIQNDQVAKPLLDKKILSLNVANMLSDTAYLGTLERKMNILINELKHHPEVILFIDEIHLVVGAGMTKHSRIDIANILKPYLACGEIKMIGATNDDHIFQDEAFRRRFQLMPVDAPCEKALNSILKSVINNFEQRTNIPFQYHDERQDVIIKALIEATNTNHQKYSDRGTSLDCAIGILSDAFGSARIDGAKEVGVKHVKEAISDCSRLYDITKEDAIYELEEVAGQKHRPKILRLK